MVLIGTEKVPVPRCEDFAKHGVRHGTYAEPVSGCCKHESGKQSRLQPTLPGQLGDRGQDGAHAEERGGHDWGEGDKLGNSIHPVEMMRILSSNQADICGLDLAMMGLERA